MCLKQLRNNNVVKVIKQAINIVTFSIKSTEKNTLAISKRYQIGIMIFFGLTISLTESFESISI